MSIPPPGGWAAPSDDWTDDPSFDLSEGGSLPASPPSSSSSRSSRPSNPRALTGSPLRQMHLKTALDDDDFVLDDNDFDEGPPTLKARLPPLQSTPPPAAAVTPKARAPFTTTIRPQPAVSTTTTSMRTLTANAMVMGQGPTGVGTITRLGKSSKAPTLLPKGSVKARALAIEKAWEADVDFDSSFDNGGSSGLGGVGSSSSLKLKLKPKLASPALRMPDIDALDDLPDLDDDDQLTLKASATLKAKLPPPRRKDDSATLKAKPPKPLDEEDLESDLVLPLNLTNLTLATQSHPRKLRPRASMTSTTTAGTDWDAPSTPSTTGRKSTTGGFSWGEDTPSLGRHSETSMTSVSDTPDKGKKPVDEDFEGEDYEDGLVLPDPTFFASRNATHLNKILDRKRKQEYAPPTVQPAPPMRSDDSFEDGLVLDNPRTELSQRRLEKSRRNRTIPAPFLLGADRRKAEIAKLGYPIPPPPPIPQSSTPAAPRSGARSPGGSLRSSTSKQQRGENPFMVRAPSRTRRTSDHQLAPPMPPLPPQPMPATRAPAAPATPHRLRTQKSHHNLASANTPALTRKQSLASMQDAIAAGHLRPDTDLPSLDPATRQGVSTSRLQMPTSSSLAKMRPPVSSASQNRKRMLEPPRRTKHWGDGTELEGIEDLRVDDDAKSPARSAGSRSPHSSLRGKKSYERYMAKAPSTSKADEKDKKPKRRQRRPAMLIKNLGATDRPKTVGEMTWNPRTLRWEGNEAVLRDFDAVVPSARPALISHITGSSIVSSPMGAAAATPAVRIVGDMKFDPEKMCWVSLLPPNESEPDPFADMADDEDESVSGGTITRAAGRKLMSIGAATRFVSESSAATGLTGMSGLTGASTATAASWEDRSPALRTEMPELWAECREAEERHRREMRGWALRPIQSQSDVRERERREEKRLWEVRHLALRS